MSKICITCNLNKEINEFCNDKKKKMVRDQNAKFVRVLEIKNIEKKTKLKRNY